MVKLLGLTPAVFDDTLCADTKVYTPLCTAHLTKTVHETRVGLNQCLEAQYLLARAPAVGSGHTYSFNSGCVGKVS